MSIFDNIAARLGYSKAAPKADPPPPRPVQLMAEGFKNAWSMPDADTAERQARLYNNLTWIATAIDRTAEIASSAVFSVKRVSGEPGGPDDEDLPNHDFERLLRRPNPSQSRGEFVRDAFTMYKATGSLYLHLNKANERAKPDEMWIIPSHMMKPIPDGRSFVRGYEFTPPSGVAEFVQPWQIMHLKTSNPLNPFVGLSALQSLALDSYGDLAQQKWNVSLFDKNNGKLPVILAFREMVGEAQWKEFQRQKDTEWGGTNRPGVMLMRGTNGAVDILQAGATQKEMEFLESRAFTKEEIYGKLAPGLASILAVNATEANAIAGKATLIEFGVWPVLVQLAEKFTSDVLPLYEENLEGAFDDIRQTNRILDLQEQAEYAKYHTVNEVRAEYYDEGPLELDPSVLKEIEAQEAEDAARLEAMPDAMQAQAGQPAPAVPMVAKAETPPAEKPSKLDPRGFLFPAQIGPSTPAPGEKPAPPPMLPPGQVPGQPPLMQNEGDALPDAEAQAELAKWEKWALKHHGKAVRDFEPRVIDLFTAGRIKAALKAAQSESDIRRVFSVERSGGDPQLERLIVALNEAKDELKRG